MKFPRDDKAQSKAFIKAAREAGEPGGSTDRVIARLAHMPPETHEQARKRQGKERKPGK